MDPTADLIAELDRVRERMRAAAIAAAALAAAGRQRTIYPAWTIRQVLAHLAGWDDATTAALQAHASGRAVTVVGSTDAFNAQAVAARQALDDQAVVAEWELAREHIKAALRDVPASRFDQRLVFPWGPIGSVSQLVLGIAGHELEHAEEIEGLLRGG